MMKKLELNDVHLDFLKEVGNIGAGHAATALSMMIEKQIEMKVPNVKLLEFDEVGEYLGGEEQVVAGIFMKIEGDIPGNMFFIMPLEASMDLLKQLLDRNITDPSEMEDLDLSALTEIGNILSSSYLSSLADFTKLSLSPTVPSITVDMVGSILSFGLVQISQYSDVALVIDTTFIDGNKAVKGHFFLIPEPKSMNKLFSSLGVTT